MLGPVMDHVAALAEGREVRVRVVGRVVVPVSRSQHHVRPPHDPEQVGSAGLDPDPPASPVTPGARIGMP